MNRTNLQSLMWDYSVEKLGLQNVEISSEYDQRMKEWGSAQGAWDNKGNLKGGLKVKVRQTFNIRLTLDTIAHELTHIYQYSNRLVYFKKGNNRFYAGTPDNGDYYTRKTEREARKMAYILTENFITKHWEDFTLYQKVNLTVYRIFSN